MTVTEPDLDQNISNHSAARTLQTQTGGSSGFLPCVPSNRNDILTTTRPLKTQGSSNSKSNYHVQIKSVPKALVPENWVTG